MVEFLEKLLQRVEHERSTDKNEMKEQDYNDLRLKVAKLLEEPLQPADFIGWLSRYAARGNDLLHGVSEQAVSEPQRRDMLKDLARFQSDQTVVDWANEHKILLDKGVFWWWLNPDEKTAKINGLDNSQGIPRITNGIDVWIERGDGSVFKGHRDWLKYDRRKATNLKDNASRPQSESKPKLAARHVQVAQQIVASGNLSLLKDRYEQVVGKPLTIGLTVEEVSGAMAEYLEKLSAL